MTLLWSVLCKSVLKCVKKVCPSVISLILLRYFYHFKCATSAHSIQLLTLVPHEGSDQPSYTLRKQRQTNGKQNTCSYLFRFIVLMVLLLRGEKSFSHSLTVALWWQMQYLCSIICSTRISILISTLCSAIFKICLFSLCFWVSLCWVDTMKSHAVPTKQTDYIQLFKLWKTLWPGFDFVQPEAVEQS